MRTRRRPPAIETLDAVALARLTRRGRVVRLALAAAAALILAAAAVAARSLDVRQRTLLPTGSTGVVVVDLSLSITDDDYRDVRRTLRRLVDADARIGLVIFSDVPYELLPPGTPSSELRPLLRVLQPPRADAPVHPWTSFRLGTRISTALELAGEMLERERVERGSILLVSDLQTAPEDVIALTESIEDLRARSIPLRVVPLSPLSDGRLLFTRLLGPDAFVASPEPQQGRLRPLRTNGDVPLPASILLLGAALLAVVAVHERLSARLALPRPADAAGGGKP